MRRKVENRRAPTTKGSQTSKKPSKFQLLTADEFDEFIDERLKAGRDEEEPTSENPIIHVY